MTTDKPSAGELLPCPFCGSTDVDPEGWMSSDKRTGPACDDCGGSTESVERWNTRPPVAGAEVGVREEVYRDIFAEITAKAIPVTDPASDDPERVRYYRIPVGPLHRAAGKLNFQMFDGEAHLADAISGIAKARNAAIEECARVCESGEWVGYANQHSPTKSCALAIRDLKRLAPPVAERGGGGAGVEEVIRVELADLASNFEIAGGIWTGVDVAEAIRKRVKNHHFYAPTPETGGWLGDDRRWQMNWERAETAEIDFNAFYLVKDNGGEWRDFDLHIMRGQMVNHKLAPNYIRGRPEWIVKITSPAAVQPVTICSGCYTKDECHKAGQCFATKLPDAIATWPLAAITILTGYQEQCDEDGVLVNVSRQALDEVLTYLALTQHEDRPAHPSDTRPERGGPA